MSDTVPTFKPDSQGPFSRTGAHIRMFAFYGRVQRLIVPDNLKSDVNKASFYEPEINRSYSVMAARYGIGILPTRPRKPRDKTKVSYCTLFGR